MIVQCPFCHFEEELPDEYAGMIGECSQCGKNFEILCKDVETPNTIHAICPKCQYCEEIDAAYSGETVTCLQCNTAFVVGGDANNTAKQTAERYSPQKSPMLHSYNIARGSVNQKTLLKDNAVRVYRSQPISQHSTVNNDERVGNNPGLALNPMAIIWALLVIVVIVAIIFETIGQHKANRLLDDAHKSFEQIDKELNRIDSIGW